jgi:hypothetical protein
LQTFLPECGYGNLVSVRGKFYTEIAYMAFFTANERWIELSKHQDPHLFFLFLLLFE